MRIKGEYVNSYIIKKSEFICYLKRCDNEEQYKDYLAQVKKKHYDASHVCSAFIIGNLKRSSDDGEPSGTAGRPILNVLEKNELDNICAFVVRYFGGIKLGASGLLRAYSDSVKETIEKAQLYKEIELSIYQIETDYEKANILNNYLENNSEIIDKQYNEKVTFIFGLEDKNKINKIIEILKGQEPSFISKEIKEVLYN